MKASFPCATACFVLGKLCLPNVAMLSTVLALCAMMAGCSHSPSQDIVGSFFPTWMLCALAGILLTVAIRHVLVKRGIDDFLPVKLLLYSSLAFSMTLLLWVFWYGN